MNRKPKFSVGERVFVEKLVSLLDIDGTGISRKMFKHSGKVQTISEVSDHFGRYTYNLKEAFDDKYYWRWPESLLSSAEDDYQIY